MNRRMLSPEKLERYALADKWGPVDKAFESMSAAEFRKLLPVARAKYLPSSEGNLQDLGATIFQRYNGAITPEDKRLLHRVIKNPGNEFAKYRASFALWAHGNRFAEVKAIVEKATTCPDVAEIAKGLLSEE